MSDLISREALKRTIMTECNPYGKPTIDYESGKRVLKIIDNAPTITPQALLNGIVEIIDKSGITTVDELLELLKAVRNDI